MSSRIHDAAHAERVTREAAKAIGLTVPFNARWENTGMLHLSGATRFAPLIDAADAYLIETKLRINVEYKKLGPNTIMQMKHDSSHGSIMATLEEGANHLRIRMEHAVILAAMVYTMNKVN